jgi:protein TonB
MPAMRARFSAYEPGPFGAALARVVQRRNLLSELDRNDWLAAPASLLLHAAIIAVLLLLPPGPKAGEDESAPAFAIQFDAGQPEPTQPQPATSQPRLNLGGDDEQAPLPSPPSPDAQPMPPPLHFGSALTPRSRGNPFAHIVPFDLSPTQQRRSLAAGTRGLDLTAGPVVRNGRLTDSVTHVVGQHGVSDYMEALSAFVEAHKFYPKEALEAGQEGASSLLVTIARDGTVKRVRLVQHSGSAALDDGWMSIFQNNKLPPLNDDMPGEEVTIPVTMNYILIYGRRGF